MNPDTSTKHSTARSRFLHFLLRVLLWSFLLYMVNVIAEKADWKKWNDFDQAARNFTSDKLTQMAYLSPLSLYSDLKSTRRVEGEDPSAKKVESNDNNPFKGLRNQFEAPLHPTISRDATIWEKIKTWCRNFWYDAKGNPNWFGRIILVLALIIAIPLTTVKKKNAYNELKSIGSDFYPLNIFLALIYFLLFFLALFLSVKLVMWIAGGITALFSGIAALGGFFKYLSEELRSELVGHSKKGTEKGVGLE